MQVITRSLPALGRERIRQFSKLTRAAVDCGPFQRFGGHRLRTSRLHFSCHRSHRLVCPLSVREIKQLATNVKVFSYVDVLLVSVLKNSTTFCRIALTTLFI